MTWQLDEEERFAHVRPAATDARRAPGAPAASDDVGAQELEARANHRPPRGIACTWRAFELLQTGLREPEPMVHADERDAMTTTQVYVPQVKHRAAATTV